MTLISRQRIDDDRWHDITIDLDGTSLVAYIDGPLDPIGLTLDNAVKITSDFAYIGGLPDIITRVLDQAGKVGSSTKKLFDNNFRGLIQDVRISNQFLLFDKADEEKLKRDSHFTPPSDWQILFPKETSNVASQKVTPTQGSCEEAPCENDGRCISLIDGFKCEVNCRSIFFFSFPLYNESHFM